jgi:hypothetical protein
MPNHNNTNVDLSAIIRDKFKGDAAKLAQFMEHMANYQPTNHPAVPSHSHQGFSAPQQTHRMRLNEPQTPSMASSSTAGSHIYQSTPSSASQASSMAGYPHTAVVPPPQSVGNYAPAPVAQHQYHSGLPGQVYYPQPGSGPFQALPAYPLQKHDVYPHAAQILPPKPAQSGYQLNPGRKGSSKMKEKTSDVAIGKGANKVSSSRNYPKLPYIDSNWGCFVSIKVTYIRCGSIMRCNMRLWPNASGAQTLFHEAVENSKHSKHIDFQASWNPPDIAQAVITAFRSVLGPTALVKPFIWTKIGPGTTTFHHDNFMGCYTATIKDLKSYFYNCTSIYVLEEGWQLPENDNPAWRLTISRLEGLDCDRWEEEMEGNLGIDGLVGCKGCEGRYPPIALQQHQDVCPDFKHLSRNGRLDAKRPAPKQRPRKIIKVKPEPVSIVKPEPVNAEPWSDDARSSSPNSVICLSDNPDAVAIPLKSRELTSDAAVTLLRRLSSHPAFDDNWLEVQLRRLESSTTSQPLYRANLLGARANSATNPLTGPTILPYNDTSADDLLSMELGEQGTYPTSQSPASVRYSEDAFQGNDSEYGQLAAMLQGFTNEDWHNTLGRDDGQGQGIDDTIDKGVGGSGSNDLGLDGVDPAGTSIQPLIHTRTRS